MSLLEDVIHLYLQIDRSVYTTKNYRTTLFKMAAAVGDERDVQSIDYADLSAHVAQLKTDVKPITLAKYVAIIRCFWRWCAEMRFVEASPAAALRVRLPPKDRTKSRAIPPHDLQKILEYVRNDVRDYAILLFLVDTGCRVGGAAGLRLDALDLIENCAVLHEKGDKIHRVFFGDETAAALRVWLSVRPDADHAYVFTTTGKNRPLQRHSITVQVRRISLKACGRTYSPHQIRHAVGHAWARAGVPVTITQRKLGHSKPQTTMEFYYPDTDEEVKSTSQKHSLAALGDRPKTVPKPGKIIRLSDYG